MRNSVPSAFHQILIATACLASATLTYARAWAGAPASAKPVAQAAVAGVARTSGDPVVADQSKIPEEMRGATITEHLGDTIALDEFTFRDEAGKPLRLSELFASGKPVLFNFVYYQCPNLCGFVMNGILDSIKKLDWAPGNQFTIISLSIDPREKADLATKKKTNVLKDYGRAAPAEGWRFLTGDETQIRRLADRMGFGYKWDPVDQQYAHSAALFILTPEGKISRYLYGIQYATKDLRLALLEAGNGKIGTVIDRFILFCFRYNPHTRRYSVYLARLMQVACFGTIVGLGIYFFVFWRRERQLRESNVNV